MTGAILGEKYVVDAEKVLTIAEKKISLSGDSFNITDADGNSVLKAKGHGIPTKIMTLLDLESKDVIITVCREKESGGLVIKKGTSVQVLYKFVPQGEFKNSSDVTSKIEIFYGSGGAYPIYFITRVIDDKTYALMDAGTNQEIGRIGHALKVGYRDIWSTTVPAGVDMAFMAACTLVLDEILES